MNKKDLEKVEFAYFRDNYANYDNDEMYDKLEKDKSIKPLSKKQVKRSPQYPKNRREKILYKRHQMRKYKYKENLMLLNKYYIKEDDKGTQYLYKYRNPKRLKFHKKYATRHLRMKMSMGKEISPQYKKEYDVQWLVY